MRARMASRCGAILGASHRIVTSTLEMAPPRARTRRAASARNRCEAAPRQRGSVWRKVLADVAVADGAEQGVGERMQADVGVGMALQRVACGGCARRTARHGRRRRSGARRSPGRCARRGSPLRSAAGAALAMSSAVVSFTLASLPSTSSTGMPAHSATAASSVRSSRPAAAAASCAARMAVEAEPLRRLRPPQSRRGRASPRCAPSGPARFRVSASGTAAMAAGARCRASSTRSTMSAVTNGRAASWIRTCAGACGLERAQAVQHRALAGGAAEWRAAGAWDGRADGPIVERAVGLGDRRP